MTATLVDAASDSTTMYCCRIISARISQKSPRLIRRFLQVIYFSTFSISKPAEVIEDSIVCEAPGRRMALTTRSAMAITPNPAPYWELRSPNCKRQFSQAATTTEAPDLRICSTFGLPASMRRSTTSGLATSPGERSKYSCLELIHPGHLSTPNHLATFTSVSILFVLSIVSIVANNSVIPQTNAASHPRRFPLAGRSEPCWPARAPEHPAGRSASRGRDR